MVTRPPVGGQSATVSGPLPHPENVQGTTQPPTSNPRPPSAEQSRGQTDVDPSFVDVASRHSPANHIAELPAQDMTSMAKDEDEHSLSDWADSDDEDFKSKGEDKEAGPSLAAESSTSQQGNLPSSLRIGNPKPLNVEHPVDRKTQIMQPVDTSETSDVHPHSPTIPPTPLRSNNPYLNRMPSVQAPIEPASTPPTSDGKDAHPETHEMQLPVRTSTNVMSAPSPYEDLAKWADEPSVYKPSTTGPGATLNTIASGSFPPQDDVWNDDVRPANPFTNASDGSHAPIHTIPRKPPAYPTPAIPSTAPISTADIPPSEESPTVVADTTTEPSDSNRPPIYPTHPSGQSQSNEDHAPNPATQAGRSQVKAVPPQRNETYQIRKVRWLDSSSGSADLRVSPILTQNANGPCPLLALVNALVLSTPAGTENTLVQTLKSRENVTLGLLLDAVFDVLTSTHARGGNFAKALPDVGQLYAFLLALHTGMNVNPRFVPLETGSLLDIDDSFLVSSATAGTFEDTKELQMYSTFAVPLIHGWLPEPGSQAVQAFRRSAPSYEDAQNVQFREEELERKLQSQELESLSTDEQNLFMDLSAINDFFSRWPTQLTEHGLMMLNQSLKPGEVAILFRNDHFSTIYKQPETLELMTLVTDQGYATHDEIVWESLVDVNGTEGQFYSGDFRSVSHSDTATRRQSAAENEWTVVQGRNARRQGTAVASPSILEGVASSQAHHRSASEQEDHDLALALQLQEEEEEQERVRRQRNGAQRGGNTSTAPARASNARISSQPDIPVRRNNQSRTSTGPVSDSQGNPAPPPYELAAQGKAFYPPRGHPANENAPRASRTSNQQSQQPMNYGSSGGQSSSSHGRRTARQSLIDQIPDTRYSRRNNYYGDQSQRPEQYQAPAQEKGDKCAVM